MNIDRSNYEAYLLDYLEGKLGDDDRRQVEKFLSVHPDIDDEFQQMQQDLPLDNTTETLNKTELFHSFDEVSRINPDNFEEWCVAFYEEELSASAKQKLEAFLKAHPEMQPMFDLHAKLHFSPEENIHFPKTSRLIKKRPIPVRRIVYLASLSVAAAAAIVLLLVTSPGKITTPDKQLSQTKELPEPGKEPQSEKSQKPEIQNEKPVSELKKETKNDPQLAAIDSVGRQTGTVILAAIDDSSSRFEPVVVASVEPIDPEVKHKLETVEIPFPKEELAKIEDESVTPDSSSNAVVKETKDKRRINLRRENIIVGALQAGVSGFNKLTESQVSVKTDQNKEGKLTLIAINTENFELTRKIKKNIQN